jgi:hypothetical protein
MIRLTIAVRPQKLIGAREMNEKTKLLAGKALDTAVSYTWTTLDYEQIHELLACHAELIVKECNRYACSAWEHGPLLGRDLLIHFGVEE